MVNYKGLTMPSTRSIPPSISVILDRIGYWQEQETKTTCLAYKQHCEHMIFELEAIKELVKEKA